MTLPTDLQAYILFMMEPDDYCGFIKKYPDILIPRVREVLIGLERKKYPHLSLTDDQVLKILEGWSYLQLTTGGGEIYRYLCDSSDQTYIQGLKDGIMFLFTHVVLPDTGTLSIIIGRTLKVHTPPLDLLRIDVDHIILCHSIGLLSRTFEHHLRIRCYLHETRVEETSLPISGIDDLILYVNGFLCGLRTQKSIKVDLSSPLFCINE